jgi:fatty-acyl-CoA synthase
MSVGAMSLDRLLAEAAALEPARPALAFGTGTGTGTMLNLGELLGRVGAAASLLEKAGVGPGDRVAIWGQNSLAWAVWFLACAWRGAAAVALHPGLRARELASALMQSRPAWVVHDEQARGDPLAPTLQDAMQEVEPARAPRGVTVMPGGDGTPDLDAVLDIGSAVPAPRGSPDAALALLFTSGSSGRPKLVSLSHAALLANARATAAAAGLTEADRIASPLPLHHAAGLSSGLILSLATGATWCGTHRFGAATTLAQIRTLGCTAVQGVPTMFKALMERVAGTGEGPCPSLRLGFVGGAPCAPDLLARARATLGIDTLAVVYGQTEFGPTISIALRHGDAPAAAGGQAGRGIQGVELRIADPRSDAELPDGTAGEIQVRGPTRMDGYVDDPDATAAAIAPGGWLRTGDLGRVVAGELHVEGRLKQIIIRGGENVSPAEVEAVLRDAPRVADACVVAVASNHWGEAICAVVASAEGTRLDVDALRRLCDERLARYKRPDHYVEVDGLPLLASGKVDRQAVAASLAGRQWS